MTEQKSQQEVLPAGNVSIHAPGVQPANVPLLHSSAKQSASLEETTDRFVELLKEELTERMQQIRANTPPAKPGKRSPENRIFMVNINGPWGSGKTKIAEGLRNVFHASQESDKKRDKASMDRRWVVIEFNAWQHQRLGSPWWWLINAVNQQGTRQLPPGRAVWLRAWLHRIRHFWWYVGFTSARWLPYAGIALVLLGLAILFFFDPWKLFSGKPISAELQSATQVAQSLATLGTLFSAVVAFSFGVLRPIAQGPASVLTDSTYDPMRRISRRFEQLIRAIGEKTQSHVGVFIEDLDRCQSAYVVELLEGIQTLFRNAPVCYVIPADQRCLLTSFALVYKELATSLEESGRPAGYNFVEKAFQLTTSVPPVSKGQYLQLVLGKRASLPKGHRKSLEKATTFAQAISTTLQEVLATETMNPRTMNRIVDACIFRHRTEEENSQAGVQENEEQLVLWTLIDIHWPLLAELLGRHPDLVDDLKASDWDKGRDTERIKNAVPDHLRKLLQEEAVQAAVKRLEKDAVRTYARRYPLGFMRES